MKNQLLLSTARSFTAPLSLLKAIIGQEDLAVCNYGNAKAAINPSTLVNGGHNLSE